MSIFKHFSVVSTKFEFGNKKRLDFHDSSWEAIFEKHQTWTKYAILEQLALALCVYCKVEDKLFVCLKTKTLSCINKKQITTLLLCLNTYGLTSSFWTYYSLQNSIQQLLKDRLWQPNDWSVKFCHQMFLMQCLSSTCWKLFFYGFKTIEYLLNVFSSNAASKVSFIIFIKLMLSNS